MFVVDYGILNSPYADDHTFKTFASEEDFDTYIRSLEKEAETIDGKSIRPGACIRVEDLGDVVHATVVYREATPEDIDLLRGEEWDAIYWLEEIEGRIYVVFTEYYAPTPEP